jgi:hypothetical protein
VEPSTARDRPPCPREPADDQIGLVLLGRGDDAAPRRQGRTHDGGGLQPRLALVELAVEALRLLIGDLDLAFEPALAAPQADPPVRLVLLVPGHGTDEVRAAADAVDESAGIARPGDAPEKSEQSCGVPAA